MRSSVVSTSLVAALSLGASVHAQVGIDGIIGAEWAGATSVLVPLGSGNSGADIVAYRTYFRTDASHAYFAVSADASQGGAYSSAANFSNLYIGTSASLNSSTVGIEVTNSRFFVPGVNTGGPNNDGYYPAGSNAIWANSNAGTIELAIPLSFFLSDPLTMGFAPATHVWFRTSQSLGYNFVAGSLVNSNTSLGVPERFGIAVVPTPGAAALLGLSGLAAMRRRR